MTNGLAAPTTSLEVRDRLVEALRLDLVGPWAGHALADECLRGWERPSNWYLTGFLIPESMPLARRADDDEDDEIADVPESAGLTEENNEERKAARKAFFPSSMGLSFLVAPHTDALDVTVRWGDYVPGEVANADGITKVWRREQREGFVRLTFDAAAGRVSQHMVPESGGLELHIVHRTIVASASQALRGTRSVSLFLVNRRTPDDDQPDRTFAFQLEIEVRCAEGFVPRSDPRGASAEEWDERVADLHYANSPGYATGHGVSADWEVVDGLCSLVRTAWIPSAQVEKTETVAVEGAELAMDRLGGLADGASAREALTPLVAAYRAWIETQHREVDGLTGRHRETAAELLRFAALSADRIERGIRTLEADADSLDAFRVANRAVARALRKRLAIEMPRWHAFQLAFLLLNLPGIGDPASPDRETVDLLFFPTGGGKTEAYLGLAAFTMVLRRLRNGNGVGAGVSVIMRYTLRLLTLDQLGRAAGLVCALELERLANPARYGVWPFEIGLWVGRAATPNHMGRQGDGRSDTARIKVRQFQNDPRNKPSPIPLENCPWCQTRFEPSSFALLPNADRPSELRIVCANFECDFTRDRPLPIVAVDEPLYRRLPAFLIATVDKFASLPWVGPSGVLLGGADRQDASGFYGAAEPGQGRRMTAPLPPPDLIIQDELHLIAGPLGTMAGLYESAIDALCTRRDDARRAIRPKVVASTATVRRAQDQIQALFGRPLTQVFPAPGPDRRDSFFARVVGASEQPARLYLGIASQGRNPKVVMRRTWLALMGAAERVYRDCGGHENPDNPADPYMTLVGYFLSLRELGGARRILEEEVRNTIRSYGGRRRIGEQRGLFQDRRTFSEPVELTSRVSTSKVAEARRRLEAPFNDPQRVDCAIATNMISVGLDIPRLGLMSVVGQPMTSAEYIQATSRVGRSDTRPGLVVTLLNIHKPRDRSHYERFRHYHETFYRSVEVSSVTPFSARALDRGFAGALVALARHTLPEMTPPDGAGRLVETRTTLEPLLRDAFIERVQQQPTADDDELRERLRTVQNRVGDLLDSWRKVIDDYRAAGVQLQYQKYERNGPKPLLREMLDTDFESVHHRKFRANRSLRDVESEVDLFIRDPADPGAGAT